uniref:[histone H3]-lysine(4) N-methyltransferase n=1 Tax=Felis catus TaxID=9685 RepID=A0ABI7VR67_FELCA
MSSEEDKSAEQPQPPPPPPEEPGAPAPSPAAADKRPRGRPRKDGASPFQRARKKPRSRGKITVEDEDSMDGLETTETENIVETEIKEQSAEEDAEAEVDISKRPVPVLERSVSEDSASSLVSVGVEVKISEQLCAFCYCGEKSSLGQGDLKQFRVTPGFILPWKSQPFNKKDIDDSSNGTCDKIQNSASRKQRGQRKERAPLQNIVSCVSVSTQTASDDQAGKLWDELSLVGLPDAIDIQALFDPTGTCWAHHRCVEWSLGVRQLEEPSPVSVDKAVVSGSTERCAFCKHLGATIKCCEDKCTQMYHYPCAAGAGTFQDFRNFFLLCPEHIDQAPERSKEDANCAVCDSPGDLLDQFFCTTCGQHYHGMCLDIAVTPLKRAGWQCPECKVCQNCKQSGEDSKMLVCDTCDKGYHTFCLQPVMKSVPTNGWKCKNCRICVECGTRSSSQWHHNCLVCDSCYQQQDNLCPFCGKCYHPELQKDMLHCNMCKRWVHLECDKPTDHELESQFKEEYICMYCKHLAAEMDPLQPGDEVEMAEVTTDCNNEMEVEGPEDHMVFPEQVVNEDISGQESTPGIVPDGVHIHTEEQLKSNSPESLDTHDLLISESSQDKMNPALENQISLEADSEKMEMSSKVMHICDENQNENKMEVTENVDVLTHQITVRHEDLQLEEPKMLASAEESRPPKLSIESATGPPEALRSPCEESTSLCSKEHLAVERVPEAMEQKESSESSAVFMDFEMAPVVESCVKDGLCQEDKSVKLPSETELSFSSAAGVSKANASSSPLSSDLPSQDTLHSYPSTLSASVGNIMPTTYISVTPKIGMGKPAITKRKFSPGRPRSKQGRGSGFPGKRRPRGAGLSGRGGRGRSKLKSGIGAVVLPGVSAADLSSNKDEEENSMHNTVVLFSSSDKFTLHQDMCVVCGSFGQGAEGRLLACSQCGQCYHPYCVSIKITKVVLSKGWRCLECTVCEACGKATDPGRLLLCDDCDISYHTYCLDPPLQTVPKGGWKCKWCVWCRHCGATSAGLRCEWQNNYTQCAPCASLSSCPVCYRNYREEDLILQCRQCDRWMHAVCQNLNTEEEVENVADIGFDCSMCRPYMPTSNVPSSDGCESSLVAQIVTKVKELDPPKTYTQDGVCLTESGMTQLQSLTVTVPRRKRSKPKLKLKIINQNSVAVLQTPPDIQSEHSRDGEMDDSREGELVDCDGKSESSPEREAVDDETKGAEGTDGVKKRKRKPYRPGIGGFMVRQRSRTGQGKTKRSVIRKDSSGSISEQLPNRDDGWSEHLPDTLVDESVSVTENTEKIKKRYRKRKNKLEETFPAYLQEAFFGKDLLDTSRQNKLSLDNLSEDTAQLSYKTNMNTNFLDPSLDPLLSSSSTPAKPGTHDIGPVADDASSLPQPSVNPSSRPLSEEQLDGILSPELDKMVTDGAILGKLYKIPELGGKDVEDLFTAVLSPATAQPTPLAQPPPPPAPQLLPIHSQDVFSRMPLMNGLIGPNPHLPHNSLPPGSGLGTFSTVAQSPYTDTRDKNPAFHPMASDPNSSWTSSAPTVEGENDTMSNAQRSTLKWEKEEALGEMATVAPVLYTNINFPSLKEEFPDWTTRVKQIAKLWRKASSQERAPYVQKARDNRAALRINKVQMSNDPLKRQQQQDSIDPGSRIDSDLFKDPLKQRESEHEQEWKFRQQMRQKSKQQAKIEATQKLEQVKNEQQQQQQFGAQPPVAPSGSDTPSNGIQSPLTPQPGNGNASPAQAFHKDLFPKQLPGAPSSTSSDDVFVKPQAPPPAAAPARGPVQESLSQPQTCQPPSPQVFSAGSAHSRPPSPVDPYAKMVGTPRPPPGGHGFSRRNSTALVENCAPLPPVPRPAPVSEATANRPSPVRDFCASSTANGDPYAKPPDTPRPTMTDQFPKPSGLPRSPVVAEQTAKGPLAAGTSDHFSKPSPRADVFQRQRIPDPYARPLLTPAPPDGGPGPFKAPMQPPPPSQDPYGPVSQAPRRLSVDPYERPAFAPRPGDNFSHSQSGGPYSQPPLTPHPATNESLAHPSRAFSQPGTMSRPTSQDPYSQPPGTPRPVVDAYPQPSGTSRSNPDPYSQPPGTPRPATIDPYSQQPPTPRPPTQADLFVPPAANQRHSDPYAHPPGTPRPYSQPPAAPRPRISEGFPRSSMTRPVLMPNQDPFLQAAQNRGAALSGPLIRPPDTCSPSPRPPGPSLSETFSRVSPSATRDAYDQPPMTPRTQSDSFGTSQVAHDVGQSRPGSEGSFSAPSNSPMSSQSQQFSSVSHLPGPVPTSGVTETQSTVNMSQADTEKLRQRQKLREIILQQQQQKKMAGRQEKGSQDAVAGPLPAPLQHWQPDSISQAFARAPPPYPGSIRSPVVPPLGPRYAVFPKDPRGPYPPDVTGMGMRPHGFRFGFPGGSHGTLSSQERFLAPPQQIQGSGAPPQLRRSMSVDMPRPLNNSQMNNPVGLPQHFPPQSLPVQQHNILGQAFIELRHRAPDGRPRLPFTAPPGSVLEAPSHPRHGNFIPRPDFPGPRHAEPLRRPSQGLPTQLPLHPNLEQVPPSQQDQSHPAHSSSMVMRSLSHPLGGEFPEASLSTSTPAETASDNLQITTQSSDGLEEKLDTDDPSVKELDVKDLEGVEVKDLDDEDLENLNLDTEDGKGDELDTLGNLETNDPNLDDLLRSGEFDIIAYTDPELDLGDKKSMFNEELDLNVPIDDKIDNQCGSVEPKMKEQEDKTVVPSDKPSPWKKSTGTGEIKTEVLSPDSKGEGRCESEKSNESKDNVGTPSSQASAHTDVSDGEKAVPQPCDTDLLEKRTPREATGSTPGVRGSAQLPAEDVMNSCGITASTPVLSSLLANEKSDNSDVRPLGSPPPTLPASPSGHLSSLPPPLMTPPGHMLDSTMNSNVPVVSRVNHTFPQGVQVNPGFVQGQSPVNHGFGTGKPANQTVPLTSQSGPQQLMIPPTLAQQSRERPLLLEEQPLLLQDLLDQERQEQQQQRQMQAMIRQRAEPFFPNIDFDAITDPIMKAKMVALKGINKVMAQNNMGMPPMVMNRFPFMGQSVTGAQTSEGQSLLPQAMAQDGSITHQISRPNPPNFGPGFVNDSQRKQYEEWLQETQQLLQMQQKYLEEQIGAHRKSKKALSAKQRTAKKAGREFPEEDAEQLKHVTEQQSMVQKQLEQIRKQQKEHAELIEDYRIKQQQQQQQCAMAPPPVMPGVPPQPPLVPGATPAAMSQPSFPMVPQQLQHQQHAVISGHSSPARMPGLPAWQPASAPAHLPLNPARIQPPVAQLPIRTCTPAPGTVSSANPQSGPPPRVEFDDNNPFSESFQERERKERLREQQERQRIQLMQEVDRQRALQQGVGVPPHGPMRSQLPFYSSDLPCDFTQPPRPLQQSPQHQQQMGQSVQQGSLNSPPTPTFMQTSERRQIGPPSFVPDSPSVPGGSPGFHSVKQVHGGLSGASFQQSPARPPFAPALPAAPAVASGSLPCGQDPAAAHGQSHPGSTQSLIQLYSDIIPEEKGKKKRTRKKKKDDDVESTKAPSTPHSDITAPPTPSISETTSTPTVNTPGELPQQGEPELVEPVCPSTPDTAAGQLCAELESRLPQSELAQGAPNRPAFAEAEAEKHSVETPASTEEVALETAEPQQCPGQDGPDLEERAGNKVEEKAGAGPVSSGQSPPPPAGAPAAKGDSGNELLKHLLKNKKSSSLLSQKPEGSFCSEDACTKDHKVVERQNPVEGLQNNLSNPPTPPASLPPTPPPMACQKMANGFATTEELAGRAGVLMSHEVTKSLGPKAFQLPFRPQDDLLARAIAQGPKTVDVPASLPTPPHNNQEELRIQDHAGGRDTPDSFVPSSSPESVVGMDVSRYPDLSSVKEEPPEPVPSPIIPILPSSTGKGLESRRNDIKTEPGTLFFTPPFGSSPNGPRSGLISVAITLHPTAAENISSVVAAFSDLLHVRVPNSYEVSNGPDVPSVGLVSSHRVNPGLECRQHIFLRGPPPGSANPPRSASSYRLKPPSVPFRPASDGLSGYKDSGIAEGAALRPQWCCHCKVVILGGGVRKSFRDLAFVNKDSRESSHRVEKDIVFCSNNCFVLYASSTQAKNSESKESAPPLPQSPVRETPSKAFHQYSNNISTLDVHCLPQLQEEASPPASPPITFPPAFEAAKVEAKPDELKVTVKLKPRLRTVHGGFEDCRPINKKWRGMKWKKWSIHIVIPKGTFKPPCEDEIDEFLKKLGTSLKPDPVPKDYRKCCFCHEEGDGLTDGPARLLNLDLDVWVHLNCALWSTEVYETQAGALINVELALRRGLQMKCVFCHKMGATSGCHRFRCANIYHFTCAIKAQCMFFKDKTMLCPVHKPKGIHEQELSYFAVFRRVYVQRDEVRQIASIVQRGERDHTFRVGSLIFHTIGQLLPQQMQAFHSPKALFPVGYEASRLYWSTRYANRRCRYLCSIEEKEGRPVFVIRIVEQGHEDLVLSDSSPKGVWDKILEPVACVRKQSEMLQLFPAYLKGEDLFGLTVSAVVRIAESLPGVEACENYTFRYGRNPLMELPLAVNPTGCARSEPKMSAHVKRPHTLNSTSTSKSFQSTVTGELNAPYSKQFVHSKSSQYRKMKTEWKSNVYLARSRIQGLGLYAARDIEKHTMVIEYIGTIIRNEVANRKEKLYESQNRGVYMFRMDSDHVIDATLTGGPARYINHSCAPNCVAEVVTFERGHKIIISSNRRIQKGEELCYDYKFDFEDDQHKIPCHCGAVNCRKWMN